MFNPEFPIKIANPFLCLGRGFIVRGKLGFRIFGRDPPFRIRNPNLIQQKRIFLDSWLFERL